MRPWSQITCSVHGPSKPTHLTITGYPEISRADSSISLVVPGYGETMAAGR